MNDLIKRFGCPSDRTHFICFPFAGGYSAAFRPLNDSLKDRFEVLAAEPPGHGSNRSPLVDDLDRLVNMYEAALLPQLHKPFILFGHSMGGIVAFRLAQLLESKGLFPEAVIVSAVQPPDIKRPVCSHLEDDAFVDYVIGMDGIPPELARNREMLEFFLPPFRSDFKAMETFRPSDTTPLRSEMHIFNGNEDESCMRDADGWARWGERVTFHRFPGGHMYLLNETEQVSGTIRSIFALDSTLT
jgi:external thioesterase TEII